MDYKRLNLRIPMPLYEKIRDYCESIGSPIGSGMCFLCDTKISELRSQELVSKTKDIMEDMQSLAHRFDALQNEGKLS